MLVFCYIWRIISHTAYPLYLFNPITFFDMILLQYYIFTDIYNFWQYNCYKETPG